MEFEMMGENLSVKEKRERILNISEGGIKLDKSIFGIKTEVLQR